MAGPGTISGNHPLKHAPGRERHEDFLTAPGPPAPPERRRRRQTESADPRLRLRLRQNQDRKSGWHDQADAGWIVIRGLLRGHNDAPFGWPVPGRPIGPPGVGHLKGVFGVFSYYYLVMLFF
jgi:hypothetical protein